MFGMNAKEVADLKAKVKALECDKILLQADLDSEIRQSKANVEGYNEFRVAYESELVTARRSYAATIKAQTENAALIEENKVLAKINANVQEVISSNVELEAENKYLKAALKDMQGQIHDSELREKESKKLVTDTLKQLYDIKKDVVSPIVISPTVLQPQVLAPKAE